MVDTDSHDRKRRSSVSRRTFVKAAGVSGVTAGLAGCITGGGDDSEGEQIDTSVPDGDITVQFAADDRLAGISDQVQELLYEEGLPENISLEVLAGSFISDDRQNQYTQLLDAGQENPTMLLMDSGWTIPFIARGQLVNFSQQMPSDLVEDIQNNYFQASVDTVSSTDGDLYGMPMFPDFPVMHYRKDVYEAAGYSPESNNWATEPMTWADFSTATADAQEEAGTDYGFTFQANIYEGLSCCDFNEFMSSWGGAYFGGRDNLFGPVGERPVTVDEQQVIDSIRMVRTFIHGSDDEFALDGYEDISPEAVLQWTEEPSRQPFTNGNAVANRNWPYAIPINGAEDAFGEDFGTMPIPYAVPESESPYEGLGGTSSALGGWHATINPNAPAEKKSAAYHVLNAMKSESVQLLALEEIGWLPPRPDLFESDQAQNVPIIGRYIDTLRVAGENAVPRPVTTVWGQQSDQIASEVNAAYAQQKSPEDAMTSLKSSLESIEESG
jgi:ABC-type glycerol-3-phosphate transport system substrate-binding protein